MNKEQLHNLLHFMMALIGGFLGAYTLLNYHDLFGNAQTTNMISLAMDLVGHNIEDFLYRALDLIVYVSGFACTVLIPRYTKLNLRLCSIFIDALAGITICFIPASVNDFVALCPVLFATAFQWNSFREVDGFVSSTIFSTNNLRQFTTSFFEYLCDKDKKHLRKTKVFGGTLLFYHIGAAISFVLYLSMGTKAGWFCVIPACVAALLLGYEKEWLAVPSTRVEI